MTMQFSTPVRNARLDAIESAVGASPYLCFYTGSAPVGTTSAYTGTVVAEFVIPADWMAAASGGSKVKAGSWLGVASGAGTVGYFRIKDAAGVVHVQGTCTITGGSGDMTLDSVSVVAQQTITVVTFSLFDPNA